MWKHRNGKLQIYLHTCNYYLSVWNLRLHVFVDIYTSSATFKLSGNWKMPMHLLMCLWQILAKMLTLFFMITVAIMSLDFARDDPNFWVKVLHNHVILLKKKTSCFAACFCFWSICVLLSEEVLRYSDMVWICRKIFTVIYASREHYI